MHERTRKWKWGYQYDLRAEEESGEWELNGNKFWFTNQPVTLTLSAYARGHPKKAPRAPPRSPSRKISDNTANQIGSG